MPIRVDVEADRHQRLEAARSAGCTLVELIDAPGLRYEELVDQPEGE